ncbi:MAG: hypothetical protein A2X12_08100 [Bacteroidetes bacterium GWE2_29_8]|nr:MAG: hypothetical protein A2X12_08100 [Bacteroidetes bacterium GWE2_29_8]OFY19368.1 MAG: hypothetical protein A2X02_04800 [Bacteroidetes bacterium GWF2_29_10]
MLRKFLFAFAYIVCGVYVSEILSPFTHSYNNKHDKDCSGISNQLNAFYILTNPLNNKLNINDLYNAQDIDIDLPDSIKKVLLLTGPDEYGNLLLGTSNTNSKTLCQYQLYYIKNETYSSILFPQLLKFKYVKKIKDSLNHGIWNAFAINSKGSLLAFISEIGLKKIKGSDNLVRFGNLEIWDMYSYKRVLRIDSVIDQGIAWYNNEDKIVFSKAIVNNGQKMHNNKEYENWNCLPQLSIYDMKYKTTKTIDLGYNPIVTFDNRILYSGCVYHYYYKVFEEPNIINELDINKWKINRMISYMGNENILFIGSNTNTKYNLKTFDNEFLIRGEIGKNCADTIMPKRSQRSIISYGILKSN